MTRRRTIALVTITGAIVGVGTFFLWPLPAAFNAPAPGASLRILDREGRLLYSVRPPETGEREAIVFSDIPPPLVETLLTSEDRTFFTHHGVSVRGILRAAVANIRAGRIVAGGSTITQQFVRIRMQLPRGSLIAKVRELLLALRVSAHLPKETILAGYLSDAYFGNNAYGIRAAAHTYFGKEVRELSTAETAFLVGLLQGPNRFDPFENFSAAKRRQRAVLHALVDTGRLSEEAAEAAAEEPLALRRPRVPIEAPHFVMWLLSGHGEPLPASGELRTSLDLPLQRDIERIALRHVARLAEKNVTAGAVVVLDADTGDIRAMVGSADYFDTAHDGAVNVAVSPRQPGSALKPFTYALAIAAGDTAATTALDIETAYRTQEGNPYLPRNYDYDVHGLVRYREALANSYNIAAVRVLEHIGVPRLLSFLRAAGITTLTRPPEHYGVALTLGSGEVTLLELTRAYGVFVRGGRRFGDDRTVLDPRVAWLITDILSDPAARIPEFGTASPLNFTFPVAAKTGTTRNSRDNWVIGFTPHYIVGVWVGNADNSPMRDTSGITGAGPIFAEVVERLSRGEPRRDFARPEGLVRTTICALSGKLPTPDCPATIEEWFIAGTEPHERDDIFQRIAIDRRNNLRASTACPPQWMEERVFAVFPGELQKWARTSGWKTPPQDFSPLCGELMEDRLAPPVARTLAITRPHDGDSFERDSLVPDISERIIFEARAEGAIREVEWLLNGEIIGTGRAPDFRLMWPPTPGSYLLEVRSGAAADRLRFEVVRATVPLH